MPNDFLFRETTRNIILFLLHKPNQSLTEIHYRTGHGFTVVFQSINELEKRRFVETRKEKVKGEQGDFRRMVSLTNRGERFALLIKGLIKEIEKLEK